MGPPLRIVQYRPAHRMARASFEERCLAELVSPAPDRRPLELRFSVQGTSAYFTDDANQVRVLGYKTFNATLATSGAIALTPGLGLRGFASVNNVFNRPYVASAFLNPDVVGGQPVAFEPGLPRSVVVGLSLRQARPVVRRALGGS